MTESTGPAPTSDFGETNTAVAAESHGGTIHRPGYHETPRAVADAADVDGAHRASPLRSQEG